MRRAHEDVLGLPARLESESIGVSQASASRRRKSVGYRTDLVCCIVYSCNHVKLKVDQCRHAIPPKCEIVLTSILLEYPWMRRKSDSVIGRLVCELAPCFLVSSLFTFLIKSFTSKHLVGLPSPRPVLQACRRSGIRNELDFFPEL